MIGPQLPPKRKLLPADSFCDNDVESPPKKRRKISANDTPSTTTANKSFRNLKHVDYKTLLSLIENDESQEWLPITNEKMHVRNIYRYKQPDYEYLSLKYDYFGNYCNSKNNFKLNYRNSEANLALTKVLLEEDFNLEFEMPLNHLCPPVTQRLNYILWIQDLLGLINKTNCNYIGFDIGTGSSCIFPLLGVRIGEFCNQRWKFIASEIDDESIEYANKNVSNNKLENLITIKKQTNSNHIFKNVIEINESNSNSNSSCSIFDFTVCNPPFFDHLGQTGLNRKRDNPGTKSELVFEASDNNNNNNNNNNSGEIGFLSLMIDEIIEYNLFSKFYWFTTMLGKKSSLKPIISMIRSKLAKFNGQSQKSQKSQKLRVLVQNTEFFQGKQTRWGVAWTYNDSIIDNIWSKRKNANKNGNASARNVGARILDGDSDSKQQVTDDIVNSFVFVVNNVNQDYSQNDTNIKNSINCLLKQFGLKLDSDEKGNEKEKEKEKVKKEKENEKRNDDWCCVDCDLLDKNGFGFSLKWNWDTNDYINFEILYHQGDKSLFDIFCQWIQKKCKTTFV